MTVARLLLALVLFTVATTCARAQTDQELTDLKALFEKDPAEGFVQAERLFEKPKREGNLEGMVGIISLVRVWANGCNYVAPCLAMAEAALPVAVARGNWAAVGDIRWAQASMGTAAGLRILKLGQMAAEAYTRAGREPAGFTEWRGRQEQIRSTFEMAHTLLNKLIALLPEQTRPQAEAFQNAYETADDSRALGLARDLLESAGEMTPAEKTQVVTFVSGRLWLPGSERLLPILRGFISEVPRNKPEQMAVLAEKVLTGCIDAWSGRPDDFLKTFDWCLDQLRERDVSASLSGFSVFPLKSVQFRQPGTADRAIRMLLNLPCPPEGEPERWKWAFAFLNQHTPSDLRRILVTKQLTAYDWELRKGATDLLNDQGRGLPRWRIAETAPPAERATWCLETAYQIAEYAPNFPTAATRSRAMTEAASYFEKAERADLAAEARELAQAYAADDPKLRLQVALAAGQAAATAGKWDEVVKGLEGALKTAAPSGEAVQGALLVREAQERLGQKAEAAKWLTKAIELTTAAKLPAAERANLLCRLAGLPTDKQQQLTLLQQAERAAKEAGLGPLEEKVSQQLAELALSTGDLATAERTLLGMIERLEAKREALAFDRLLRMQWFANNLGPYRKLLRVAVQRGNGALALWVGEKMRGRALADQLAWQKVDLGVQLPREWQQRLEALRTARTKTYALLQRALGGEQLTATDLRGAYIPIRGSYLPIRGPLGDQPLTDADLAALRQQLDDLGKEEAALASVIREQVPAYAEAATPTPSSADLLRALAPETDLAVLQYTLCDTGLVVVGLRGNQRPRAALLPLKGEDLRQQIGQFRELIWERKPEANDEAVKLYNQLVRPVESCLTGAKRLWVVGDGALQLIPFGALIGPDRQYLIAHHAVATTPSLTLALSSRGQRTPGRGAVVMAAPDTGALALAGGEDKRGSYLPIRGMYLPVRGAYLPIRGEGVSPALTAMAAVPLPGAKAEGEALGKLLPGATLLTDKQATKTQLEAAAGQCDLLHIATHGYADPDTPEFSGLLTAGEGKEGYGTLTALEIYMWRLQARLVTLSACQTALGQTVEGEGILGLTRAFLYAGAQDVLCTLWPVADDSTKTLMTAFYENLTPQQPLEQALRQAQLTLAAQPATAHPFFWAGFTAVRGPE